MLNEVSSHIIVAISILHNEKRTRVSPKLFNGPNFEVYVLGGVHKK